MMKRLLTLNDAFPDGFVGEGIFNSMVNPPWMNDIDGSDLDMLFFSEYGDRPIAPLVSRLLDDTNTISTENISKIARLLLVKFKLNWEHLYEITSIDYDILKPYEMSINVDITNKDDTTESTDETHDNTISDDYTKSNTGTDSDSGSHDIDYDGSDSNTKTNTGGVDTTREGTEKLTGSTTSESTSTINDKTYGFNSDTAVPTNDRNTTTNSTETPNTTNTNNVTESRTDDLTEENTGTSTYTENHTTTNTKTLNLTETTDGTRTSTGNRNIDYSRNGTITRTGSSTRTGNLGLKTNQEMIQSEIDLWKWNFVDNVFKDVVSMLGLPIYEIDI